MLSRLTKRVTDNAFAHNLRIGPELVAFFAAQTAFRSRAADTRPAIDYAQLANELPNSGPIPQTDEFSSAREIIESNPDLMNRQQAIEGFEGFATDDAVFDPSTESWEFWSNSRLAAVVADVAYDRSSNPAVLEMGCGAAHLFSFLRKYGIKNYVGIDGNPYFLSLNPLLRGHEKHFLNLNLQEQIALTDDGASRLKFDVVLSFEVLEHIREDTVDNFIATAREHLRPGGVALLSASRSEGMDVHVLVQDEDWWEKRFAGQGLVPVPEQDKIRRRLARHHPFNWDGRGTNIFALRAAEG